MRQCPLCTSVGVEMPQAEDVAGGQASCNSRFPDDPSVGNNPSLYGASGGEFVLRLSSRWYSTCVAFLPTHLFVPVFVVVT